MGLRDAWNRLWQPAWEREASRADALTPVPVPSAPRGRGAPGPRGRSSDLWSARAGRHVTTEANDRAKDIEALVHLDSLVLRAAMAYQDAAEQAGIDVVGGRPGGRGSRSANRAHRAVSEMLHGIRGPLGEGWKDLWAEMVGQLALHSNTSAELVLDVAKAKGPENEAALIEAAQKAMRRGSIPRSRMAARDTDPVAAWRWGLARRLKHRPWEAWKAAAALGRALPPGREASAVLRLAASLASPLGPAAMEARNALEAEAEGRRGRGFSAQAAPDPSLGMVANAILLPWPTMHLVLSEDSSEGIPPGWPLGWVHNRPDSTSVVFGLDEVMYGWRWRVKGEKYGSPAMEAASGNDGDLRALRALESLDGQQAQADVHPMRIVNFGTAEHPVRSDAEMDKYQSDLEALISTGWLVGNGLVSGNVVGSSGEALDLRPKLEWWLQRLVVGTGLSPLRFGIGISDINRATAEVVTHVENTSIASVASLAARVMERQLLSRVAGEVADPESAPRLKVGDIDPLVRDRRIEALDQRYALGLLTRQEVRTETGWAPDGQGDFVESAGNTPGRAPEPGTRPRPRPSDKNDKPSPDQRRVTNLGIVK